jgi:sugar-specific transcriptional regulator TrmB
MDTIVDYLKQLDLSDVEAKLYLMLLQTGPVSVRDLAATIDIKRTTAYFYIDQLVEKGLIIKLVRGSKKLVAAEEPENLQTLIEKKLIDAKTVEQKLPAMLKEITKSIPSSPSSDEAEIRYYKGIRGVKKIFDEAYKSNDLRLYVNLSDFEHLFMPSAIGIDYHMFDRALKNYPRLHIHEILADTPEKVKQFNLKKTAQSGRYKYRFMLSHIKITAPSILMYDNNVAILNLTKGQIITFVLHNKDYYNNSINLFEYIWSTLPDNIEVHAAK